MPGAPGAGNVPVKVPSGFTVTPGSTVLPSTCKQNLFVSAQTYRHHISMHSTGCSIIIEQFLKIALPGCGANVIKLFQSAL